MKRKLPRPVHVYVAEFEDGSIKIGRSNQPAVRLKSIGREAPVPCGSMRRSFVSDPSPAYSSVECKALEHYKPALASPSKREWFVGLDFDEVCYRITMIRAAEIAAADMPRPKMTRAEAMAVNVGIRAMKETRVSYETGCRLVDLERRAKRILRHRAAK